MDLSILCLLSTRIQKRQFQKCFLMNENHFISTQIMDLQFGHVFWIDGGITYLIIAMLTFWFTIKIRCHSGTIIWFTIASAINPSLLFICGPYILIILNPLLACHEEDSDRGNSVNREPWKLWWPLYGLLLTYCCRANLLKNCIWFYVCFRGVDSGG